MANKKHPKSSRLDPTLSRGIIAVLFTVLAAIIILSFFDKAGFIGVMLDEYILSFLFGSIRYAAPAIILILSWFLIRDLKYNYRPTHGMGALLFFLSVSSVMHLSFETSEMWRQALDGHGGGIFGMLAWPMKEYLGSLAGYIILIGLVIISIFLIFNTTLAAFVLIHKKIIEGFGVVGKALVCIVKKLFVPKRRFGKVEAHIESDYEDDIDEEHADEPIKKRSFFKKHSIADAHGEDDEDELENDEDTEEQKKAKILAKVTGAHANLQNTASDVWSRRVVIKNLPPLSLLSDKRGKPTSGDIQANAQAIHDTFGQFNIGVEMGEVRVGPTVTQYSLKPDRGIKLTRITSLSNDLALALAAHPIRIEAPIPGKSLVGIEVPNEKAAMVSLKELLETKEFKIKEHAMMIALGKDVAGKTWFADLPKMPHLLIAGATGSGKTVCVNTILMSLLYQNTAETLRMIMVDPKRVELTLYNGIPHLLTPVITNTAKTVNALKWTISEMDRRFELLASVGSRDLSSYNAKFPAAKIPQIVFVIDELADLMATAANEVEAGIIRLAQMARAVGIHLIVATQRPSVDVITGLMKANIPGRIAFSVASLIDSRTILDVPGAEKLLGRGDMLFQTAELSKPVRIQGAYVSEEEMKRVVDYLKGDEEPEYDETIVGAQKGGTINMFGGSSDDQDPLFEECKHIIIESGKASASYLQRRLKIGYARAARILDELEEAGVIGPAQGAKPREILVTEREVGDTMHAGTFNSFDDPVEDEETQDEKVDDEVIDTSVTKEEFDALVDDEPKEDEDEDTDIEFEKQRFNY